MTLNQIIAKFQTAAESHKQVNKFVCGASFDFAVEEVKYYPLVWLVPNGFIFDSENKSVNYKFLLMVMDRHFESMSNTLEVLSDTALIIQDLLTLVKRNSYGEEINFVINAQAEPFMDSKTDILAGYGIEIEVNTTYLDSYCDIPM